MTKLSTVAFPEEVRENVNIQVQLVDLLVDTLENERIRHESPVRLLVAINLVKSQ